MSKQQLLEECDFAGYATRYNVKCGDGRVIKPKAFAHHDGQKVPLVWRHFHDDIDDVLGHGLLEERSDGVYMYGFFNKSEPGKKAKERVDNGDLDSLSIYANELKEVRSVVSHGVLREVSLVLAGKNPGAKIDYVSIQHEDSSDWVDSETEAIITFDEKILSHSALQHEGDTNEDTNMSNDSEETVGEIFDTLSEKQKEAVYVMLALMLDDADNADNVAEQDGLYEEGDYMKHNIFSQNQNSGVIRQKTLALMHDALEVLEVAQKNKTSLKSVWHDYMSSLDETDQALMHAGTYGVGSDRENLEILFPDAVSLNREPRLITRDIAWVKDILSATNHTPFSRVKTVFGDLTPENLRARGYVTGNEKVNDVIAVMKRVTTPQTIYKKNKLDRDDILDVTDFSIVMWLKASMRLLLDEEIARCVFISDGRDAASDDKINETNIRPIYGDDPLFTTYIPLPNDVDTLEFMDAVIGARTSYKGSGSPTLYVGPTMLTAMLLLRDEDGRRMFKTIADLSAELTVSNIKEIPPLDGATREVDEETRELMGILVNLTDYTHGADKGGQVSLFEDFDIDYNQEKYLIETRLSGALTVPKCAVAIEKLPAEA